MAVPAMALFCAEFARHGHNKVVEFRKITIIQTTSKRRVAWIGKDGLGAISKFCGMAMTV